VGQLGEKLIEFLLTLIELTTAYIINPEERHDAVDDQEAVLITDEELGDLVEEFQLMLRVDSTGICDVLLSLDKSVECIPGVFK
jgi:hypothetical protein